MSSSSSLWSTVHTVCKHVGRLTNKLVYHYGDRLYFLLTNQPQPAFTLWQCRQIDAAEPILQDDPNVSPLALPYCDEELGKLVDAMRDSHWRHEEIHMTHDTFHYRDMDEDTQSVLDTNLRFFAIGDNFVVENLVNQFARRITLPVATTFYSYQIANEEEHKLTYARLIQTMVTDEQKRKMILDANDEPALKLMADWIDEMILNPRAPLSVRLLNFVFVEGVIFTSSFAFIFWLRSRNLCPALGTSNEFISRDENLHAVFALTLYKSHIRYKLDRQQILQLVHAAMDVCDLFVTTMFRNDSIRLLGMNQTMMKVYVRHVANMYFAQITDDDPIYPDAFNPFPSIIRQSIEGKTNFFESDVSEYKKSVNIHPEHYSESLDF